MTRQVRVEGIRDGAEAVLEPTPAELSVIKALQELQSLERLRMTYRLAKISGGAVRLTGRLHASAVQTCVVTLEPVPAEIDIPVETEFWPDAMIDAWRAEADEETLADPQHEWPEPIADGRIDLGPLLYETFATALDPYPRSAGAEFDWAQDEAQAPDNTAKGPFAALEQLKRR